MSRSIIEALAYEEAQRLLETYFQHHHPYTVWMEIPDEISRDEEEMFCREVELELKKKGEKITREGKYFKIDKFQKRN